MCENEKQKLERGEGEEEEEKQARVQQDFLTLCAELNMDQVGWFIVYLQRTVYSISGDGIRLGLAVAYLMHSPVKVWP